MQDTETLAILPGSDTISRVNFANSEALKSRKRLSGQEIAPQTVARFHAKYVKSDGCWMWTAAKFKLGYGMFGLGRKAGKLHTEYAHRVAYALANGEVPAGPFVIMHTCDERACVNPAHLRLATQAENIHDGMAKGRIDLTRPRSRRAA